jgi:hypothetical protein
MKVDLIMKKIFVVIFIILATFNPFLYSHDYTHVSRVDEPIATSGSQPDNMPNYATMIKNRISCLDPEYVKYSNEKVMFFADPSTIGILLGSFITLAGTALGIGWLGVEGMFAYDAYTKGERDAQFFAAMALFAAIPVFLLYKGISEGVSTIKQIAAKLSSLPYVTISKEGFFCYNKHLFNWNQLAKIDLSISITKNQYGAITDKKVVATMKDSTGKKLFEVSSEILSPDLLDALTQCADYYHQQSLDQQAMNN